MTRDTLEQDPIAYKVRKSRRARHMRLSVYNDGSVVVSVPWRLGQKSVEQFVKEKLAWVRRQLAYFEASRKTTLGTGTREEYLAHKEAARALARERLAHFNALYGFHYHRISIRNQKTRWGSCSRTGNLNFSYKLVLLPPALADYVIVHELCHLGAFDHSPQFWALVAQALPDYKQRRAELRKIALGGA